MQLRRWLPLLLAVLSLVPHLEAKHSADWDQVKEMKWDTPLRVQLWGGQEYFGHFDFADDSIFRLKVPAHDHPGQTATSLTFDRLQVQLIMKISTHDPGLETYSRVGTAVGAAAGATALGLAVHHSAWPAGVFFGGLGGAGVGMVAGSTAALIVHQSRHHRTIIYESQHRYVPRPPDARN